MDIFLSVVMGGAITGIWVYFFLNTRIQSQTNEYIRTNTILQKEKEELARSLESYSNKTNQDLAFVQKEKEELIQKQKRVEELETRILQKETKIDEKEENLEKRYQDVCQKELDLDITKKNLEETQQTLKDQLSNIAKLSEEEAKELLLTQTETKYEKDILGVIEKKKGEIKLKEKELSQEILIKSMQQYAAEVTAEFTQTTFHLENDDVKGKLIGKEGRNIIAFERATGVSLIIDDTPDTVFISSYDLFRRFIAKKSLEELIEDKRIQPARIEEIVEKNQREAEKVIFDLGEQTLNEMGISGIPSEITSLIGKLRFRTSYGQNILVHSKEVAYIGEAIAKEIGADPHLVLKGGLLHDIGKSLDHDIEGTHTEIGAKLARKHRLGDAVTHIIEGHHDSFGDISLEAKIIQIADAISAVRPGARRMNAEEYIKRIQEIEELAASFPGVKKAFALSAGREVRVFVDADTISDIQAENLAREIANSIEEKLNYPGEIKVNLIREKRIIEYAR